MALKVQNKKKYLQHLLVQYNIFSYKNG